MKVKLVKELLPELKPATKKKLGFTSRSETSSKFSYNNYVFVDLSQLDNDFVKKFYEEVKAIGKTKKIKGIPTMLFNFENWLEVITSDNGDEVKPKTVQQFAVILREIMKDKEGHRIFMYDKKQEHYLCYYIERIIYHKSEKPYNNNVIPEHTDIKLTYLYFGKVSRQIITFWRADCANIPVIEALHGKGISYETPALRKEYEEYTERYIKEHGLVGKQYLARGFGQPTGRWDYFKIAMEKDGEPSNVVIDIKSEKDDERDDDDDEGGGEIDFSFWKKSGLKKKSAVASRDDDDEDEDDEDDYSEEDQIKHLKEELDTFEVPTHPYVVVFVLKKHIRTIIHIAQLKEYIYDHDLGEKLVLPEDDKKLISLLLNRKVGFEDIVKGKSKGAIVLCTGRPGTGKTLTAEVYAEVCKRPLYTVQCSQLGIDAEELEKELLEIFKRAQRWNAILLLDEADVYLLERGRDLEQNAIVGVFLRTLEYYNGIMFLTSNRGDLIDDAIASRCIAKINYNIPAISDQIKIWKILSETAGINIMKEELEKITKEHKDLSGRDIKNLIKLGMMLMVDDKKEITAKTINFVKQFKPTTSERDNKIEEVE